MKKYLIFALITLFTHHLAFTNSVSGIIQIQKLCIPYYDILIEEIQKLKKENNVTEFLILDLSYKYDKNFEIFIQKYFKNMIQKADFDREFRLTILLYSVSSNIYAKIYTDTSIFRSVEISREAGKLFNQDYIKKISFNNFEHKSTLFPGSAPYYCESLIYWNFKDTYYFYYGEKYLDECISSRKKDICDKRKETINKLKYYIYKKLDCLVFDKYHQWDLDN